MKGLIKILTWLFFIILAFIFQANHFFGLNGINPNLILLVIFFGVILEKEFWRFLFLIFTALSLLVILWTYGWKEILVLGALGLLAFWLKKFLTGNIFFDFLILILAGTLCFYLLINWHFFVTNPIVILAELIYNMALGSLAILLVRAFSYEKKTRIKS